MTDEPRPDEATAPEPAAAAPAAATPDPAPTVPNAPAADAGATWSASQTGEAPTAAAPPASWAPAPAASGAKDGITVPRWVAGLVIGLVAVLGIGGIGFALGRATAPEPSQPQGADLPGQLRRLFGNGNGNGGNGPLGNLFGNPNGPGRGNGNDGNGTNPGPGLGGMTGNRVRLGVALKAPASGEGAEVTQVVNGSPADDAGMQAGDVITKVGDQSVSTPAQLVRIVRNAPEGRVTITFVRNGSTQTAAVDLQGQPVGTDAQTS